MEELNQAKLKEKEIIKNNKMETDNEYVDPMLQIVNDAQNRAKGFSASDETERIASHEKMESVTLAKEFKKVRNQVVHPGCNASYCIFLISKGYTSRGCNTRSSRCSRSARNTLQSCRRDCAKASG